MINEKQASEIWERLELVQEKLFLIQSILRLKEVNPRILNDFFIDNPLSFMIEAERLELYKIMKNIS